MGTLRIIGGDWRGRRLLAPDGLATRPLPDRIRQSLFDLLGQRFDGLVVVDICAGSGSFGLEAASRGAARVHLVEDGAPALAVLRRNLEAVPHEGRVELHPAPFEETLATLTGANICFVDPPFPWFRDDRPRLDRLLTMAQAVLAPEGRLVLRGERGQLPPVAGGLKEIDRRDYGRSWVVVLTPRPDGTATKRRSAGS